MHTKDNQRLNIRVTQQVEYTLMNVLSDEWILANGENTTILGGIPKFIHKAFHVINKLPKPRE